MSGLGISQNVLNGGEISPLLYARYDIPKYQTGSKVMENFVPMVQGGVTKRPGLRFCGMAAKQGAGDNVRLIPFVFSTAQTNMLEFSDGRIRIWNNDGTLLTTEAGGTTPYTITSPYKNADIPGLSYVQSNDVIFIASKNHPPYELARYGTRDWRITKMSFLPSIDPPTNVRAEAVGDVGTGNKDIVEYEYAVTAIDAGTGQESELSEKVKLSTESLSQNHYAQISWTASDNAASYRVYKKKAGVFGFIGRTEETTFDDKNIGADIADTSTEYKDIFNGPNKYPSIVFFHQQRLGFASSNNNPLTIWFTKTSDFYNLGSSTPPKPDDSIEVTLASNQSNRILWVAPDRNTLAIGTEGSEWLLKTQEGSAFTPTNLGFEQQSSIGSDEAVGALKTEDGILFMQRGGSVMRSFNYDFQADKYIGSDLTLLSRHILKNKYVTSWVYQQEPHSVVWCTTSTGDMVGLTYMKSQEVIGWHRHSTPGFVQNAAVLPSDSGDRVWAVVQRTLTANGRAMAYKSIELMEAYFDSDDNKTAFFVDSGTTVSNSRGMTEITGLQRFEGAEVTIFADGATHPSRVVEGGKVVLDNPAKLVHVGLEYVATLIPCIPDIQISNTQNSFMMKRLIKYLVVRLYRSMNFNMSLVQNGEEEPVDVKGHEVVGVKNVGQALEQRPWWSGDSADVEVPIAGFYKENANLRILSKEPVPVTILATDTYFEMSPTA